MEEPNMTLQALDCPRCGPQQKQLDVDPVTHKRTCPKCSYEFEYREGMPTHGGEFDPPTEAVAAAESAPEARGIDEAPRPRGRR
jgi:ribosomal protein S27AE